MASYVVAVDWQGEQLPRGRVTAALQPLESAGAKTHQVADALWFSAAETAWRPEPRPTFHASDDLILLLDGYLIDGPATPSELADLYRRAGAQSLEKLDGSFVIIAIEPLAQRGLALTDRAGSRPLFAAWNDDGLLLAPELKCFRADPVLRGDLDPAALPSMLLNSYFFDEMTYWRGVRALGSARRLEFNNGNAQVTRYWTPPFRDGPPPSPESTADAVAAAVQGHTRSFHHPAIALSGGVDSRLILAAARRAGLKLPTVTWSYLDEDTPESDMATARALAQRAGFEQEEHRLSWATLADEAPGLVEAADGLVGHLGGFADRRRLAEDLAQRYDALLFGDECYRGEAAADSIDDAIAGIGVQPLRGGAGARLARFFLQDNAADSCLTEYGRRLDGMLADIGADLSPQNLHDRLYWQVRLPRLLTGPKALWRRRLEPSSPLLSARLIVLAAATPPDQRVEKRALRNTLRQIAPDLGELPYATRSGRVKWRRVLKQAGPFQRYLVETLLDPLPAFDRWFDRRSIELACRAALAEQPPHIANRGGILRDLRRRADALLVRPMLRPPILLGLLTIKLWLSKNA